MKDVLPKDYGHLVDLPDVSPKYVFREGWHIERDSQSYDLQSLFRRYTYIANHESGKEICFAFFVALQNVRTEPKPETVLIELKNYLKKIKYTPTG